MIIALHSATPDTELYLLQGDTVVDQKLWHADRQLAKDLLKEIEVLLQHAGKTWDDIDGLVVYKGPGSFTGLRIGCMVFNTIAYSNTIPIIGSDGEDWLKDGTMMIIAGKDHRVVLPNYGAEPRITTPRK
jgi:tRNA threonylcarbamoyladenosine biosynthesis protein TsaB